MRQESRREMLGDVAGGCAATIVRAVQQEYPNDLGHPMTSPQDRPRPREIHRRLRLLRLAFLCRDALGPGAAAAPGTGCAAGPRRARGTARPSDRRRAGHRGRLLRRSPALRAPLRLGMGAAARPRTVHLGRPGRSTLGGEHPPTGRRHRRAVPGVAGFADWLDRFLPGLANGHPSSLFEPAIVSDPPTARSSICTA